MARRLRPVESFTLSIDYELRASYEAALSRLAAAIHAGPAAWHAKYVAIADIVRHEPPLYLAASIGTESEFFKKVLGESRQSVWRHLRLARLATPAQVARYSPSRLSLAIAYVEAQTKRALTETDTIDFERLQIQLRGGRTAKNKPFSSATYADLLKATVEANKKTPASSRARTKNGLVLRT